MQHYVERGTLKIAKQLDDFINIEAIPGTGVDTALFWQGAATLIEALMPINEALLAKRDALQLAIDERSRNHPKENLESYKQYLTDIGYLEPEPSTFEISTTHVDPELASMAGPQLVVPINNARYAINAANARWGSLYDAAYGTDVISEQDGAQKSGPYNPVRGQKVIHFARQWLDTIAPINHGSHRDVVAYDLIEGKLVCTLSNNEKVTLANPEQCVGYTGDINKPTAILLQHNGLHAELQFDPLHPIGKTDPSGLKDILIEAALSTIMDCEDSVAAVDAEDKTLVYQNWLGLMKGTLSVDVKKGDKVISRTLNQDREYTGLSEDKLVLKGRSLMFIRNVGLLMSTDAILLNDSPIPEGIMDGIVTALIAKHDLDGNSPFKNSTQKSVYIVKPKMHGPEEVAFSNRLFDAVEELIGLPANTLKMGIMDEERRTSVNLSACIEAAKSRVVFINTGFLDRTGDEIHTSMHMGPFAFKAELKTRPWIHAYEKDNVTRGLAAGLSGKAQIGKGMWPIPDNMADMMEAKLGHPKSGANTAWVPSPTAATLHALHYHQLNVFERQETLSADTSTNIDDILSVPLLDKNVSLDAKVVADEVDNNVQGILGYVVRWINQGVGCSKVPDIHNVGLMEDRATLRISSQHLANWLLHGIITEEQVEESLARMAKLVDQQNKDDSEYISMCPDLDESIAYKAASALIFEGTSQPSGYTEPLLHAMRRQLKERMQ